MTTTTKRARTTGLVIWVRVVAWLWSVRLIGPVSLDSCQPCERSLWRHATRHQLEQRQNRWTKTKQILRPPYNSTKITHATDPAWPWPSHQSFKHLSSQATSVKFDFRCFRRPTCSRNVTSIKKQKKEPMPRAYPKLRKKKNRLTTNDLGSKPRGWNFGSLSSSHTPSEDMLSWEWCPEHQYVYNTCMRACARVCMRACMRTRILYRLSRYVPPPEWMSSPVSLLASFRRARRSLSTERQNSQFISYTTSILRKIMHHKKN